MAFHQHDADQFPPVQLPIDGVLDLHAFSPKDVKTLVPDYLHECQQRGILEVRIIHGKGTGILRTGIHRHLKGHMDVKSFRLGVYGEGEDGVTVVTLK